MALPLADRVFGALSQRHPSGIPAKDAAERKRIAARYKDLLRSARRYYLDDEVTDAAVTLGYQHPDVLAGMLFRARTPFEKVWIEWPLSTALNAVGQEADEDAPDRIGVLVEQLHPEEPIYRMTVMNTVRGEPSISSVSVLYHLTQPLVDIRDEALKITQRHNQIVTAVETGNGNKVTSDIAFLLGSAYTSPQAGLDAEELEWRHTRCQALGKHATFVFSPMVGEAVNRHVQTAPWAAQLLQMEIQEFAGTWRNVIAALALINAHSTVTTDSPYRAGKGTRLVNRQIVPFLEHHVVKLRLPKKQAIRKLMRDHRESIPRRRHEVSGSWRERHDSGDPSCDHVWVDVTATRQTCEVCGRRQWWVRDYARGDASVGIITKDRLVTRR